MGGGVDGTTLGAEENLEMNRASAPSLPQTDNLSGSQWKSGRGM